MEMDCDEHPWAIESQFRLLDRFALAQIAKMRACPQ